MQRDDRERLRDIRNDLTGWVDHAHSITSGRAATAKAADRAVDHFMRSAVTVSREGRAAWRVVPLRRDDGQRLDDVARHTRLRALTAIEESLLTRLETEVAAAISDVRPLIDARRFFSGSKKKDKAQSAADFLIAFHHWGSSNALPDLLSRLSINEEGTNGAVAVADALDDRVGLARRIANLGWTPEMIAASEVADLPGATRAIERALHEENTFRSRAVTAGNKVRERETRAMVAEMPVERLKDATKERLRIGALTDAGIATVRHVIDRGSALENLPGIGATTATRMRGAAHTLWQTTYDEMPTRIDINRRTSETTELLRRLAEWDAMRKTKDATADIALAKDLASIAQVIDKKLSHAIVFAADGRSVDEFRAAVQTVVRRARTISDKSGSGKAVDPWDDFLVRPADYYAMLAELGFLLEDEEKIHGDLPDEIVEAVRALELDTEHLAASLRGYQSFGARFALVQRKVIIGDEMGLGKTVEALAVLAHLRAKGSHHALVICPAAVVTNWMREVADKSALRPHRVHGRGRESAAQNWLRSGGVAVTTFETLKWFENDIVQAHDLGCVVIDEAHYIKNPFALRTQRATQVLDTVDRAILLTGTPLENRIDEFRNLVSYLRPDLVVDSDDLAPRRFRRQVAPAYLRRNQEDVLTELPDLVEVDEWVPMSTEDVVAYREAVVAGNFMAMRQACMVQGERSQKVQRLIEIVEEAEDNGRRVIVFSHFRSVLDLVARSLPGEVFGPLTGSVPAAARQVMVDQFSAAGHGAVLVSQIVAGGVGLNIQAASVVIICEPQLKPTTEWQAIARAHRMGQLESVQVHRLLSEEGVDLRVTEILAKKSELFAEFARISETAGSAPEAFDVSESDLAREVVAAERERLFYKGRHAANSDEEQSGTSAPLP